MLGQVSANVRRAVKDVSNFDISYKRLKQITVSSSGIILASISVRNHHRSSILCYVIKHIRCLAISYRKSDIDVMRNVDIL